MEKSKLTAGFTEGVWEVIQERADQINKYDYTAENQADNPQYYDEGQLVYASKNLSDKSPSPKPPKNWDTEWWEVLIHKPYTERLAIAGAFLACEIDRLKVLEKRLNSKA